MILMMLFVVSMEGVGAVKLCPLGWTGFREEKCYRSVKEMMIWEDANSYCNTLGGNVAVITSEEEEEALKDMIESDTDFHEKWISVRKPIDTSGWFVEDEGKSSEESSDKHVLRLRCVYMFYEEKSWSERLDSINWNESRSPSSYYNFFSLRKTLDCPGKAYFICEMESGKQIRSLKIFHMHVIKNDHRHVTYNSAPNLL